MAEHSGPPSPGTLFVKAVGSLPEPERDRLIAYLFESAAGAAPWGVPPPVAGPWEAALGGGTQERALLFDVARLLAKGMTIEDIAAEVHAPEEFVRHLLPRLTEIVQPRSKLEADALDLFAQGLRRRQVAGRLKMKERELAKLILVAIGRESLRHQLSSAGGLAASFQPGNYMTPRMQSARTEYQMVPVRLAEAQHRRLKKWCEEHDFSMAVVMRGLVERFLDEQEKRAP
jgi:hypothetical protein